MESLWLVIPLFFVLLIINPWSFKIYIDYNVLNNQGRLILKIYFVKILSVEFKISGMQLLLFTNKKTKKVNIKFSEKQVRFLKQFSCQMKQKVKINKLFFGGEIGIFNAEQTAIICGWTNILSKILFAIVKDYKNHAENIQASISPIFNRQVIKIQADCNISISFFDVIYGLLMSSLIIKRSEKYERVY